MNQLEGHLLQPQVVGKMVRLHPLAVILVLAVAGVVAGIAGVIDMRLVGIGGSIPVKPLERLYPLAWWGFWINAITGTTLMIADATTKLTNLDFYVKMVFVFSGVALIAIMRKKVFRDPELDSRPVPANIKRLAWLSLACWTGAITAGRLLAYLGPVSGVPGLTNQ